MGHLWLIAVAMALVRAENKKLSSDHCDGIREKQVKSVFIE